MTIMRLVSFFVLSVFLHAAALAYPVSFGGPRLGETIRVTVLPMEQESPGGGGGGNGSPMSRTVAKSPPRTPPAVETRTASKLAGSPEPQVISAPEIEQVSDSRAALIAAIVTPSDSLISANSGSLTASVHGASAGVGAGGAGTGGNTVGAGSGTGSGNGSGSSESGTAIIQARYRDTPRPEYPESARRDGHEGRVLLRVLVDDQGHAKQVEINRSSGTEALDRAAAEAIKRWRFHPARHGDWPIESWLRIPIEFHLADASAR